MPFVSAGGEKYHLIAGCPALKRTISEKSREEVETEWKETCASAASAVDSGEIDDIVEPAELRARICAALNMLVAKAEGVPTRKHANLPL